MDLKGKLIRNFGANMYGQLVTVFIQLVSVPLFLHLWGVKTYGEWIILTSIPAYLALSDVGFSTVAANDMTMRVAAGDRDSALRVFQSVWIFVTSVSLTVFIVILGILAVFNISSLLNVSQLSEAKVNAAICVLCLYSATGLQMNVINAAFRCVGQYAYGTVLTNTERLLEWLGLIIIVAMGGNILDAALSMLLIKIFGWLAMMVVLYKKVVWIRYGFRKSTLAEIRRLIRPAVAFMSFPLGLAMALQGIVLIIGITLGSAAVVIFSTYRTFTRLLVQAVTLLNQSLWPEISAAFGSDNIGLVKLMYQKASLVSFYFGLLATVVLSLSGKWFVSLWTHHAFEQNEILLVLMVLTVYLNILWQPGWVVLMAVNKHEKITVVFLLTTFLAMVMSYFASKSFGVEGVALLLMFFELPMLYFVSKKAMEVCKTGWKEYSRTIFFPLKKVTVSDKYE